MPGGKKSGGGGALCPGLFTAWGSASFNPACSRAARLSGMLGRVEVTLGF